MTRISLAEREAPIKRKLDAYSIVPPIDAPANSGLRRTPGKIRLLRRLRAEADRYGRALPSTARLTFPISEPES